MKRHILIGTELCVCSLLIFNVSSVAAEKAPFTLQVPVELNNLHPDIKQVLVQCGIHNDKSSGSLVAMGDSAPKSVGKNRNLKTTFTVNTELFQKADPATATNYRCQLSYKISGQPVSFELKDKYTTAKKGTSYTVFIKGKL